MGVYGALLREYRALLREYRALLSVYRALLRECRALLTENFSKVSSIVALLNATHCNTLQHNVTHYNTQLVTHYNTQRSSIVTLLIYTWYRSLL